MYARRVRLFPNVSHSLTPGRPTNLLAVLEMCHEPVSSRGRSELEIFYVGIEVTSGEGYELLRLERPLVGCQRLINYREVVT